jgi:hypothetical protein
MSCCRHWHHGPWCDPPRWWYEQSPMVPPMATRRRRREELEDYLAVLEEQLQRVKEELADTRPSQ